MNNDALIPPFRYALVEKDVYRGAFPRETNLRFLKRLRLRCIVSLLPKAPGEAIGQFCAEQRIELRHFTVPKFKEGETPLGAAEAQTLLELLIDPRHHPLYVHCLDGVHNTGMLIMLLRKLQCWNLSAVIAEFTRFVRGGSITSGEAQFVERFRGLANGIQLPADLPPWLWEGHLHAKHPTLLVQPHPDTLLEMHRRISSNKLSRLLGTAPVPTLAPVPAPAPALQSSSQPQPLDAAAAALPSAGNSIGAATGAARPRAASRSDSESDDGKDGAGSSGAGAGAGGAGAGAGKPMSRQTSQTDAPFIDTVIDDGTGAGNFEAVSVSRDFVALDLSLSDAAQLVRRRR